MNPLFLNPQSIGFGFSDSIDLTAKLMSKLDASEQACHILDQWFEQLIDPSQIAVETYSNPHKNDHERYFAIRRYSIEDRALIYYNMARSYQYIDTIERANLPLAGYQADAGRVRRYLINSFNALEQPDQPVIALDAACSPFDTFDPSDSDACWMTAHYILFSMVQLLILLHQALVNRGAEQNTDLWLRLLSEGFELCKTAFAYGGHFGASVYNNQIRPSMGPPHVLDGFSDLYSVDHSYLIGLMRKVAPLNTELKHQHPEEFQSYVNAIDSLYDLHAYVCKQCVGDQGSLKADSEDVSDRPAYMDITEKFKTRTLRHIGEQ